MVEERPMKNYQFELEKMIKDNTSNEQKLKLLLHSCCAPCSSYVLEYLRYHFDITVFYYNPNIFPVSEMILRVKEQEKLILEINQETLAKVGIDEYSSNKKEFEADLIKLIIGPYEKERFYNLSKGLEKDLERGERCKRCYKLRLEKTAWIAKEQGFDYFTTTLSVSPLKDAHLLNHIGSQLQEVTQVKWLLSDFKKKNGYRRSVELSNQFGLYRQNYCGCEFSLENR